MSVVELFMDWYEIEPTISLLFCALVLFFIINAFKVIHYYRIEMKSEEKRRLHKLMVGSLVINIVFIMVMMVFFLLPWKRSYKGVIAKFETNAQTSKGKKIKYTIHFESGQIVKNIPKELYDYVDVRDTLEKRPNSYEFVKNSEEPRYIKF